MKLHVILKSVDQLSFLIWWNDILNYVALMYTLRFTKSEP